MDQIAFISILKPSPDRVEANCLLNYRKKISLYGKRNHEKMLS